MDTLSLTYDELADRLGISGASARNLVRRKKWNRATGNDGKARISVPVETIEGATSASTEAPTNGGTEGSIDPPSPVHILIAKLEVEVAGLRELIQAERGRADTEAKRANAIEADRDAWRNLAQRSWWRRLAG